VADVADLARMASSLWLNCSTTARREQLAAIKALSEINDPRIPELMLQRSIKAVHVRLCLGPSPNWPTRHGRAVQRLFKIRLPISRGAVGTAVSFRTKASCDAAADVAGHFLEVRWKCQGARQARRCDRGSGLCRALQIRIMTCARTRRTHSENWAIAFDPVLVLALMDVQSLSHGGA